MRKFFMVILLVWAGVLPSQAGTDAATVRFLERLNLDYYSLRREGMKSFDCGLRLTFSEKRSRDPKIPDYQNDIRFHLSGTDQGKFRIRLVSHGPEGVRLAKAPDPALDKICLSLAKGIVQTWSEMEIQPFHDQEDYDQGCVLRTQPDGFLLDIRGSHDGLSGCLERYDSKRRLVKMTGKVKGTDAEMDLKFIPSPQGFLAQSMMVKKADGKVGILTRFTHGTAGKYRVPTRITTQLTLPDGKDVTVHLDFSNFRIEP